MYLSVSEASISSQDSNTKTSHNEISTHYRDLAYFTDRPKLGVEFNKSTSFKLESRKSEYRVGELFSLDLAILNILDKPIFIHNLDYSRINFRVQDDSGKEVGLISYTAALEACMPEHYQLLESKRFLTKSFSALVGCDNDQLNSFLDRRSNSSQNAISSRISYEEAWFQQSLFVNWGDFCLKISQPGSYTITAEITENSVIIWPNHSDIKTSVGKMISKPLSIKIIE